MVDAVVLLAAQQRSAVSSSSKFTKPSLKTSFAKERAFQPFYTGGSIAFTPDAEWMAATMNDEVVVLQVKTGIVVKRLEGDTQEITALTISPSGSHLITSSRSMALITYTLPDLEVVRNTPRCHDSQVNVMAIDPTSTLLATGSSDGNVKVWDITGGYCTHSFRGHGGVVSGLCWNMPSPTVKAKTNEQKRRIELFTASVDGKVRLWDLTASNTATNKPAAILNGHVSVVRGIALSDDGNMLVSGARDRTVIVWRRLQDGRWKQGETLAASEGIESLGFLAPGTIIGTHGRNGDQTIFYTGGSDGQIKLWDAISGTIICREPAETTARPKAREDEQDIRAITALHYIPAAASLISVHADQNIVMRSVASDTVLPILTRTRQMVGFNDEIVDLALLSEKGEEESHIAVATNSSAIRVYNLDSQDHNVELLHGHSEVVLCLDRSPDSRWMASGGKDRTARVWAWVPRSRFPQSTGADESDTGKAVKRTKKSKDAKEGGEWICVAICEGHAESVGAIAFARRSTTLGAPFMFTASQDRTAKMWDLSVLSTLLSSNSPITEPIKLKSLLTLKIHDKDINCLDIAPNNALLASGSQDRTAKIFGITYNSPSKANHQIASAQLKLMATLKGHKRGVWSVRFSPVDLALATGSGDRTIRLWGLKDFTCVKIFEGHTNSVLKLEFLSAGMQLLSSASDGLVKLWNVKDEECVETLDGHDEKVWSIVVKRDESMIVSAAADSVINFWHDTTEKDLMEKERQKEELVVREQDYSNLLTLKDYRNAVGLALKMGQPRRLLGLFRQVSAERSEGDGTTSAGLLLDSALRSAKSCIDADRNLVALQKAGVVVPALEKKQVNEDETNLQDSQSVTGLYAVDQVLATLSSEQLVQLFSYVRDWNTSARTANIAQTVLHALLRSHTAEQIIVAFEGKEQERRAEEAKRLEDEELGVVSTKTEAEEIKRRKEVSRQGKADLASMLDGLLPYTERHYSRADRTLIESAMVEFTLCSMDAILGPVGEDEDEEEHKAETSGFEMDVDEQTFEQQLSKSKYADSASESDKEEE